MREETKTETTKLIKGFCFTSSVPSTSELALIKHIPQEEAAVADDRNNNKFMFNGELFTPPVHVPRK